MRKIPTMNSKKIILVGVVLVVIVIGILLVFRSGQKSPLTKSLYVTTKAIKPSETFIEYADPSGFTFSYPDNLSIIKNEVDANTYADIQLSSNQVNGSLSLKISDSKFKSIDEWVNLNKAASKEAPKEVNLGNLKALEIKTNDRLLLGALDQGILFSIEVPLIEENFWMKVYSKFLTDFSFAAPEENVSDSASDVIFEGEEVVE